MGIEGNFAFTVGFMNANEYFWKIFRKEKEDEEMSFEGRREYLFMYTVVDANPNGDPLNQNHPRYDEDTEQVLVSDVRIKRTIRDQWVRENKLVFVDGESKTLKSRFEELKTITGKNTGREVLGECMIPAIWRNFCFG